MGSAGSWIAIAVITSILTLVVTYVILKMSDPWDWIPVVLVFFGALGYGLMRSNSD